MLKVLIAEDEPLSLQNLSGQMRDLLGADALIEGVANGREAVERACQIQPQLVLMDIEMPVMNGLDAAAIIHKAMPETRTARVFELFSLDTPGFSGFLPLSYPVCGP